MRRNFQSNTSFIFHNTILKPTLSYILMHRNKSKGNSEKQDQNEYQFFYRVEFVILIFKEREERFQKL